MNKDIQKIARDKMPDFLKYIAAPVVRNKLINNKEFLKYYRLLEERESFDSNKLIEFQFEQLKKILIHSFENVPYYYYVFKKVSFDPYSFSDFNQIKKIPFLTREDINKNFNNLISRKKIRNGYYVGSTGGSSGLPLKFLLDYDSVYKENAFIYYFRKKLGYNYNDKLITFRQVDYSGTKLCKFNPMHNETLFLPLRLSKSTISEYARKFNKENPQYINGYLSAIWYFARLLVENSIEIKPKLRGIFLISENIDHKQRAFVEQFFGVKSSTFYGHSERVIIAEEKAEGRYQFDPYYGYTEQVPFQGNKDLIVGTGFLNYTMPLIRYQTDDVCTKEDQYYLIEGKRSSSVGLVGLNDEFVTATVYDLEDRFFKNITSYQFIQNEKGKADMHILVNNEFKLSELDAIINRMNKQTEGVLKINVRIVERLQLTPRGKYQMYILNIPVKKQVGL